MESEQENEGETLMVIRYALPRRRGSLQRRRFPRIHFALRLGFYRHRALHWTVGRGSSLVSNLPRVMEWHHDQGQDGASGRNMQYRGTQRQTQKQQLRQITQGHLHHWHIDPRRRRQGSTHPDEELDLHHLLRSRGHLRGHHEHRLLGEDGECVGSGDILCWKLLHGIRALLVGTTGRSV
jgi:hypothetical protein